MKILLKFAWIAFVVGMFLSPAISLATSCAGRSSFLELVQSTSEQDGFRIVHVRVVHEKITTTSERAAEFFELLEFLDAGKQDRIGGKFFAMGSLHYLLNVAPNGVHEPLPNGSEWILVAHFSPTLISPSACGAILEFKDGRVRGFIKNGEPIDKNANQYPEQEMTLGELRREIDIAQGKANRS